MEFFVYILQSEVDNSFYKGSTDNLVNRLKRHNAALEKYTKKLAPWNLVWYGVKHSRSEARILERKLKNLSVIRTLEFINKYPVNFVGGPDVAPLRQSGC